MRFAIKELRSLKLNGVFLRNGSNDCG